MGIGSPIGVNTQNSTFALKQNDKATPNGKKRTFGECIKDIKNSNHASLTVISAGNGLLFAAGTTMFFGYMFSAPTVGVSLAVATPLGAVLGVAGGLTMLGGGAWLFCAALKKYCSPSNQSNNPPQTLQSQPKSKEGVDNQGFEGDESGDAYCSHNKGTSSALDDEQERDQTIKTSNGKPRVVFSKKTPSNEEESEKETPSLRRRSHLISKKP